MKTYLVWGLALVLSGCASAPPASTQGQEDAQGADVVNASDGAVDGADDASSFGLASTEGFSGNPLEDPNSPLSNTTILFDFDSSQVASEYLPLIDTHADFLLQHPEYQLTLEGHTDERGSREYNIGLGEARAKSVKRLMQLKGVDPDRITVISYGEEKPADSQAGEEAWQKNRRAELIY